MLGDGQKVFYDNKIIAQKFVWATLLTAVRGVKPTGLGGKVIDGVKESPLSIATATIPSLGLTVGCDKDGRYQFPALTEGVYTLEFKADGYKTLVVEQRTVKAGVKGRLNVALEAIATAV